MCARDDAATLPRVTSSEASFQRLHRALDFCQTRGRGLIFIDLLRLCFRSRFAWDVPVPCALDGVSPPPVSLAFGDSYPTESSLSGDDTYLPHPSELGVKCIGEIDGENVRHSSERHRQCERSTSASAVTFPEALRKWAIARGIQDADVESVVARVM